MKNKESEKIIYYDLSRVDKHNCRYTVIFGKRSNGKTTALLKKVMKEYVENNKQGAYIRRFLEDFRGKRGQELCRWLSDSGFVKEITNGKWESVVYYSTKWYFSRRDMNDKIIRDEKPFMYGFALNEMEHDKGAGYPDVTTLIFDEFISRTYYLTDEFVLLMNVISTIVRLRDDARIYLLGNTVNKYCPYFKEMGLKHVREMNPGDIDIYKYNNPGLTVAVEFSTMGEGSATPKSNAYFAFDNPKLQMITGGIWELEIYPHLPVRYVPKEVILNYFIKFEEHTLHAEIVHTGNLLFTYIHEKTTPIQNEDKDIIFSQQYDPRPNWFRNLRRPTGVIDRKISEFFRNEKVFYQDNEIGEVVRNYLLWCQKSSIVN